MPTTVIDNVRRGPEIVTGYDFSWTFDLRERSAKRVLTGATIQAALVTMNRTKTLIEPIACSSSAPGAAWANSLVTVEFPATATALLAGNDSTALVEISVLIGGKRSEFHALATIHTGRIP